MDKEQINELKLGDEVLIRGRFKKIKGNGDFQVSYPLTTVHGKHYIYRAAVHPDAVIIKSPPKHNPTRLLKEGDIVKPRFVDGRTDIDLSFLQPYTVTKREDAWGNVRVMNDNHSITTKAVFLELVTPVEEISTYRVGAFATNGELCVWKDQGGKTEKVCSFNVNTHPNAKAAAEAERDRLNAKSRKERGYDA